MSCHLSETSLDQTAHERQQVAFEDVWRGVILRAECIEHPSEFPVLHHQLPDPRAHLVQAEIRAGVQIQGFERPRDLWPLVLIAYPIGLFMAWRRYR